jgi:Smr domain
VSIIESLKKLVDPIAARETAAEQIRLREKNGPAEAGPPPTFECRVCGHLGPEPDFCPDCLAQTMRPSDKVAPAATAEPQPEEGPPIEIPIDGTLDLHTVSPREVKDVVTAYVEACAARGIYELRIVHGKGTGALRRTVEAVLGRLPQVERFRLADESAGGWGATLATLRRPPDRT